MRKIVVKREDGGVSIITPLEGVTEDLILRDILAVPGYVSHREIEDSAIPGDRYFRNAWTDDLPTTTVDIDIEKAKAIKKDIFRSMRANKFPPLDVAFMKAVESGDDTLKSQIAAKKQELRDVTTLALSDNIEELKKFVPDCLNG